MSADRAHSYSRRETFRLAMGLLAWRLLAPTAQAAPPMRVVTLFQGATDTAVALGVTPCGVVDSWSEKPMYRYLRAALAEVPHVGLETQPSLEDIALLEPDLIVASRFRHERIAVLLEQLCPVLMLDEVFEFEQTLLRMGAALHRRQLAMDIQARWRQRLVQLRERLERRFADDWPLTVSVLDIREDHVRSYLPGSFSGSVLDQLGFAWSVASRSVGGVSIKLTSRESLPVVDADIFFVFLRADTPSMQRSYQALLGHPLWQRLRAPQRGRVWQVDGVAWSLSGGILGANLMLDDIERVASTAVAS
ncbi:ABC transporter substrate-binding protein [Halotalea alkalilenta]|nr:iron-siderophore ABC transporter substrate-binding protein [Halotalea alkalilenta]